MNFDLPSLEEYLDEFSNQGFHPLENKLETMSKLCAYFGHPEDYCPCFHVAGSKGKGTIAGGIAAILRKNGYKTGVYSSPHVYHFTERISDGVEAFEPKIYAAAEKELKTGIKNLLDSKKIEKSSLTWFELVTIFAMLTFRETKVDYVIYEVGRGGRLDVTNVIHPLAIGMGPIELEHTDYLGNTLAKIATEKSGVFKPNVPIISAPQAPEVQAVFKEKAARNQTEVEYINESDYRLLDAKISASCVKKVLRNLNQETAVSIAFNTSLPGRYELIENYRGLPYLLMDGAHTENSIKSVLARMKKDHIKGNLIFACAKGKNVEKIAAAIIKSNLFETIYLTRPGDYKKSDFTRMKAVFSKSVDQVFVDPDCQNHTKNIQIIADPDHQALIKKALTESASKNLSLVVLGSMYLPSEVKKVSQILKNVL